MAIDDNRFLMLCHHPNHLQSILEVYRGQCSQYRFHNLVSVTMTNRNFRLNYSTFSTHALKKLDLQSMVKPSFLYLTVYRQRQSGPIVIGQS